MLFSILSFFDNYLLSSETVIFNFMHDNLPRPPLIIFIFKSAF